MYTDLLAGMILGFILAYGFFMSCYLLGCYKDHGKETCNEPHGEKMLAKDALRELAKTPIVLTSRKKRKPKVNDDYNAWVAEKKEQEARERV